MVYDTVQELMNDTADTRSRRALYYPYLSIRDVHWLKATLLAFGQIQRMMPEGYNAANDDLEILSYENVEGPFGPLVRGANIDDPLVWQAQDELQQKLERNLRVYKKRYGQLPLGPEAEGFQIHAAKLFGSLPDFSLRNSLAWHPEMHRTRNPDQWLAVHPRLGTAILSTLSGPIAERGCLDIVTDDPSVHRALLRAGGQPEFDAILHRQSLPAEDATVRLLHVVITSNFFDLRQLGPEDIADLLNDHAALSEVRQCMREVMGRYPATRDTRELHQMLEAAAQDATAEWVRSTRRLPARMFGPAAKVLSAVKGVTSALIGHRPVKVLSEVAGLAICIVEQAKHVPRTVNGPYRYLSSIASLSGELSGGLFLPAWSQLPARTDFGEFHTSG